MKRISTVGIIGAGTMGSALAQKFAMEGFRVVLADRAEPYLKKGTDNIESGLHEAAEKKVISPEAAQAALSRLSGTTELSEMKSCDLVIEAIHEDFGAKANLFESLSSILPSSSVIATNTSSFSVNELSQHVKNPERFLGLHYFFHAAKNRLVEVVPCAATSREVLRQVELFNYESGKDAIRCKDSNGFVVNRFFVPWLNESARLLEEGMGDIVTIDKVCREVFGIGMGPFALMNATGVPVAYHSEKTLEVFGNAYNASERLRLQTEANQPWDLSGGAEPSVDPGLASQIKDRMLGIVFFACAQLLAEGTCSAGDINRGARIGLRWKRGPVEMMQKMGEEEVKRLLKAVAERCHDKVPAAVGSAFWKHEFVELTKNGKVAVLQFMRPEDLNALNEVVVKELGEKFDKACADPNVETIVLTGSGKAFVAGADIGFFIQNMKAKNVDNIVRFTRFGQEVLERIDRSPKRVVAMLNGMTFGGGLELALCADLIFAVPKSVMAFPETGIGIYPGLGGTQRTPKRVGKGLAKYLVFTGTVLKAAEAAEIGLIDGVLKPAEMFDMMAGETAFPDSTPQSAQALDSAVDGGQALTTQPGDTAFQSTRRQPNLAGSRWETLAQIFGQYPLNVIMDHSPELAGLPEADRAKLVARIKTKAPIPLKISEQLIDEAAGPESELRDLRRIFSTEDAMLGLSSIGKRVEFSGK